MRISGIYDLAEKGQILSGPTRNINGTEIGPLVAGDSAYPLTSWLIKPYPDRGRFTSEQKKISRKFSALRCVVGQAFGILKGRWRLLFKKNEQKTSTLKKTVIAACVLHNICIERGDLYDTDSDGLDDSFEHDESEGRAVFNNGIGLEKHLKTL